MTTKRSRSWSELDLPEKMGYIWVVGFAIVIIATATVILVPKYYEYLEEMKEMEEGGSQYSPTVYNKIDHLPEDPLGIYQLDRSTNRPQSFSYTSQKG
jgi:hypothetical protein